MLFVGGLCRSLQFTCLSTLSFSEVPPAQMSGASTFSSTVQQLTMGMGIAFGALALHAAMLLGGRGGATPVVADFRVAFGLIAVVALAGVVDCLALKPQAGAQVSGHRATPARRIRS